MAYVEVYNAIWYDFGGTEHEIKLIKEGGSNVGAIAQMQTTPYIHKVRGSKKMPIEDHITGSEIKFNFVVPSADIADFDAIFESEYKDWKVEHYYDSVLDWVGWLQPENYSRKEIKEGDYYFLSLSAVDGLANLKNIEFVNFTTGAQYDDRVTIMTTIKRALEHVGHELDFKVQLMTWCSNVGAAMDDQDCALDKCTCDSRRFIEAKDGRIVNTNCYEVISELLRPFNCYLMQSQGFYWIVNTYDANSFVFNILWSDLSIASRAGSDLRLDIINAEDYTSPGERQKIRPFETVGVSFRDRNLGDNLLSNGDFAISNTDEWNAGTDIHQFLTVAHEDDYELKVTVNPLVSGNPTTIPNFWSVAQAIVILGDDDQIQVTYKLRCVAITMDGAGIANTKVTCQIRKGSPTGTIIPSVASFPAVIGPADSAYTIYSANFNISDDDDYYLEFLVDKVSSLIWDDYDYIEVRFDDISMVTKFSTGDDITFDRYFKINNTDSSFIDTHELELKFGDSKSDSDIAGFQIGGVRTETWNRWLQTEDISINILAGQNIIENYSEYKVYKRITIIDDTDRIPPHVLISFGTPNFQIASQTSVFRGAQRKEIKVELIEVLTDSVTTTVQELGLNTIDGDASPGSTFVQNPTPSPTPGVTDHGALTGNDADDHNVGSNAYHTDARGDVRYTLKGKPNFSTEAIKTLSTGVATSGSDRNLIIAAESGTTDDMIELTGLTVGDKILLRADTGDTITVKHNDAGATIKILIQDDNDFVLDEQHPLELALVDTNELVQIYDEVTSQDLQNVTDQGATTDNDVTISENANVLKSLKISNTDGGNAANVMVWLVNDGGNGFIYYPSSGYVTTALRNKLVYQNGASLGHIWLTDTTITLELSPIGVLTPAVGYGLNELSTDPSDPAEGNSIMWQSDGTGSGDDGDIMMKITAGGSTKTTTIVDFSAI